MSSSIWMRCGGDSELRALGVDAWRVVEAQHQVSTRKLVDSDAEQQLLEQLIDEAKPPDRTEGRLHYLLLTPFRYPPLRRGSRFGTRAERGIWYGSEALQTAFSEVAYYRLLFLEGTTADLGQVETALTAFRALVQTSHGVDLTAPPFAGFEAQLASRTEYGEAQAVGHAMREARVEAFRYRSARDAGSGVNIGVLATAAFGRRQPHSLETWHCVARRADVELARRDYFHRAVHRFVRDEFLVDGALPSPAL